MLRIKTPASSANLGPGMDCLGLALDLYNTFDVESSDQDILVNVEERFNTYDNLFLYAFRNACAMIGAECHVKMIFHGDIPASKGLGSSASWITAGITAASVLHGNALTDEQVFQLAAALEEHPDNAAPCCYGGLTASCADEYGLFITRKLKLSDDWVFTVLIPEAEVSTASARTLLPECYDAETAVQNAARAVLLTHALENGDLPLLKRCGTDQFHEPYRKALIPGFDRIKEITETDTGGVMVISGSGPSCLLIAKRKLSAEAEARIGSSWQIKQVNCAENGIITEII